MDILLVTHEADYTGAPKIIFAIAGYLAENHKVTFVTKMDGPMLAPLSAECPQVEVIDVNTNHQISSKSLEERVCLAVALLEERRPEFVFVNTIASADWLIASRRVGIPNALYAHEMIAEYDSLMGFGGTVADFLNYSDYLLIASNSILSDYQTRFGAIDVPFQVVNTMIDCDQIDSLKAESLARLPVNASGKSIDPNKTIVYACGTACHRKGTDIFFELAKAMPSVQFLWIGAWENRGRNSVQGEFDAIKLDNFYITEETSNPYNLMAMSDIFVLTSREDPNPLVVTESLYLGKQCVCFTDTGSSKDQLSGRGYVIDGTARLEPLLALIPEIVASTSDDAGVVKSAGRMYVRDQYDAKNKIQEIGRLLDIW